MPETSGEEASAKIRVTDRRFWVRQDWDSAEKSTSRKPSYVEKLEKEIKEEQHRVNDIRQAAKQVKQEGDSYRQRLDRDIERKIENLKASFFCELLEVLDNIDRSLEHADKCESSEKGLDALVEGIQMVRVLFLEKLTRQGVDKISVEDQTFNPETAEAMDVCETTDSEKDNHVVNVLQDGYRLGERIIRPARVRVAKYVDSEESKGNEN